MPQPLVTIITPSYNQAGYLRATIESVLSQDYPNLEYIIMDGGSSDESAAIAAEYSSRLTWVSERDRGQSDAINKGFRAARGEVLAWLNSDDLLLQGAVSHAVQALEEHPSAGAIYGEGNLIDSEGRLIGRFPHTQRFNLWRLLYRSDYILQQTAFFRAAAIREVGYLREDLHYTMDWDLFLRLGKRFPLYCLPTYLGCLRVHNDAKTSTGGGKRLAEIRRCLRAHTGEWLPGGWILYAGGEYGERGRAWVERRLPERLQFLPLAVLLTTLKAAILIGAGETQGVDEHGWASPDLVWLLPPGEGMLEIEGEVPSSGWLDGQAIQVWCNGSDLGSHRLEFGSFHLSLPAGPVPKDRPSEVRIRASHSYIFAPDPAKGQRQISYRLGGIKWASWR